ncbi:stromal membrane-associated protein 1 isoform X2 [Amia ocellicauda]|uniref:stromal membrane-associated protein 1 isoform X2 n=1 Tax=Amia ocellicauda TaxID=2972642 RepID=UPI0034641DF3
MTTRSEREKAQKLNEQHQAILSKMLREEDNKYCADCEAKGPRWASWNLGVFICIRCAGIHRNLGVHISRVKSVNLDQWTPEQIQSVQDMGNTRARKLYEANLPDNFRRPQTDQAVEFFIRDKYEKKKYYDKNGMNGTIKEKEKKKEEKREKEPEKNKSACFEKVKAPQKKDEHQIESKVSPMKSAEPAIDLLGLDAPAAASLVANGGSSSSNVAPLNDDLDIFGPMVSNPLPSSSSQFIQGTSSKPAAASTATATGDLDLFTETTTKAEDSTKKPLSKDSILSLYSTGSMPQQTAPAGMYMGPSQMQFASQPSATFQGFPSMGTAMPPTTGMMGPVIGQSIPMMGQNAGMMVGMTMPNGFMGNTQTGVMGLTPNVMGPQGAMAGNVVNPQNMYAMQPNQQGQWNISQMNQQMAGMNVNGPVGAMGFGQPANTMGNWTGTTTGQTLSTQLWK